MGKKGKNEREMEQLKELVDSGMAYVCDIKMDGKKLMGIPYDVGKRHLSMSLVRIDQTSDGEMVRDSSVYETLKSKDIVSIDIMGTINNGLLSPYKL